MSEDIRNYIGEEPLGCCFSDISGRDFWKAILGSYWHVEEIDEALEIPLVQGVLLHGPFGSGKHTLIQAMAGEMIQGGYRYLELDFRKIPASCVENVLDFIVSEALVSGPVFLCVNHLENLKDADVLWNFYGRTSQMEHPMLMVGAVEDESKILSDLRRLFHIYWIDLPDRVDRKHFLSENLEELFDNKSIQGMEKMLDGTEGYNYIQLESFVHQLKMRVKYAILKEGKTLELAMAWMENDYIEEVLSKSRQPKKECDISNDLAAILKAFSSVQMSPSEQTKEQTKPKETDPLDDLRAKYSPKKVFDQGLMFAKNK